MVLEPSRYAREDDCLIPGLSPDEALAAFEAGCNQNAHRLFITPQWFAPFRARLKSALPTKLTESIVVGLRHALYKRQALEKVIEFVEQQPLSWEDFALLEVDRERQRRIQTATDGIFPWADVEASAYDSDLKCWTRLTPRPFEEVPNKVRVVSDEERVQRARACPGCGRPANELTCVGFCSPEWTWEAKCGRSGLLIICESCHMQVDFICKVMN